MKNDLLLKIPGREVSLGGFTVKRVLPYATHRMVGPFIFLDHMGPHLFAQGYGMNIGPHPHIGLSTLTYLFEGRVQHRDSLGSQVIIQPGEVNWMTAGYGIAHSERSPEEDLKSERSMHGLQIWVALPDEQEDREPSFVHVKASELPNMDLGDAECVLVAGSAHGKVSPVPVYSPLFLIDSKMKPQNICRFDPDGAEVALYVSHGSIRCDDQVFESTQMAVMKIGSTVEFEALTEARVFILGGTPFKHPKHVWWNFVSSSREKIELAKLRWDRNEFPPVIHESNFSRIPLPQS